MKGNLGQGEGHRLGESEGQSQGEGQRRDASKGREVTFFKRMTHHELEVLRFLEKAQGQPVRVPQVVRAVEVYAGGSAGGSVGESAGGSAGGSVGGSAGGSMEGSLVDVEMRHAGYTHLERVPQLFSEAIRILNEIRPLDLPPAKTAEQTFGLLTLQDEVRHTVDVAAVAAALRLNADDREMLQRLHSRLGEILLANEPFVASHGDFHPRNILVEDGQLVVLDWEMAGLHSVYRDIYGLVDMCYPDADARLTRDTAELLRTEALRQAADACNRPFAQFAADYETYLLLERLIECRQIAGDLAAGRRDKAGLLGQAGTILADLRLRVRGTCRQPEC